MKYFDAFSGYGGFSLGIQKAYEHLRPLQQNISDRPGEYHDTSDEPQQWECVGYSEIDKYAVQVYSKHFPYEQCAPCHNRKLLQGTTTEGVHGELSNAEVGQARITCNCKHKPYGSITDIDASTLPDFDLFVGGFPCQAFSIAGKRGGFEDTRGTLIYDVLRIVKEKHPRTVLLENVKGLLSHDSGRTFKAIITALAELGYAVEWQVLNAKNFGVPQNRERVFIIGHLGGFGGRAIFPFRENNSEDIILPTITTRITADSNGTYVRERQTHQATEPSGQNNRQEESESDNPDIRRREAYTANPRIRRLTPTECERLMGLPDGWTEGVSDTQRYKLCGNGVVVNVVEEIMKRII